jgi:YfiH family protein
LQRKSSDGIVTYHFEALLGEGLVHAVFTRLGGVSQGPFASLNVGNTVGDDAAAVTENHARVYDYLGLDPQSVVSPRQVHGNRVATVGSAQAGQVLANTDGLVTGDPGTAMMLRFADCQPILLYDPAHHALGLVHVGWRGLAQGIARRAVEAMREAFDTRARDLIVGLGPAIGSCCYVVGQNVAAAMAYALDDWKQALSPEGAERWRLDLSIANAQQLAAEGVPEIRIERSNLCTACSNDLFYSHRANQGRTGRFAVVAVLREGAPSRGAAAGEQAEPEDGAPVADHDGRPDSLHPPGLPAFGDLSGGEL